MAREIGGGISGESHACKDPVAVTLEPLLPARTQCSSTPYRWSRSNSPAVPDRGERYVGKRRRGPNLNSWCRGRRCRPFLERWGRRIRRSRLCKPLRSRGSERRGPRTRVDKWPGKEGILSAQRPEGIQTAVARQGENGPERLRDILLLEILGARRTRSNYRRAVIPSLQWAGP